MARVRHCWLCLALVSTGCSADAVPESEPTFRTPGAFLAARIAPSEYTLSRTIGELPPIAGQQLLVVTQYTPVLHSLAAARELAQDSTIPIRYQALVVPLSEFSNGRWEVVWFRSLTEDEKDAL